MDVHDTEYKQSKKSITDMAVEHLHWLKVGFSRLKYNFLMEIGK